MHLPVIAALTVILGAANAIPRGPGGATSSPMCQPDCSPNEVCITSQDDGASDECYKPEHSCGGFRGNLCPDSTNFKCVDDPRDTCDPLARGRDCLGVCVPR